MVRTGSALALLSTLNAKQANFMQDWENNSVAEKAVDTVARALLVIEQFGAK